MKVTELNKEQMTELKLGYLSELVNEGTFAEVLGVDYNEPTWSDLANVNNLIPDDLIIEHYALVSTKCFVLNVTVKEIYPNDFAVVTTSFGIANMALLVCQSVPNAVEVVT